MKKRPTRTLSASYLPYFWALLAGTALSCAMLFARISITGRGTFTYLVWNLFLAWIPFVLSFGISMKVDLFKKKPLLLLLAGFSWLLFFPNAPYIVTDFIHLKTRPGIPLWFDALLIFSFALNGLIIALFSLRHMHEVVEYLIGKKIGWFLLVTTIYLTSFGIYLGRVLRWNSWDIVAAPLSLMKDVIRTMNPFTHPNTTVLIGFFFLLLLWTYLPFYSVLEKRHSKLN